MPKTENRFIRIEDWKGNAYYPQSESASSTAGSVTDSSSASSDPESTTYTDGQKIADSQANGGTTIILTSTSTRQTLFSTCLSNIPFGKTSVGIRLKSSNGTTKSELLEVNTYFVDNAAEEPVEVKLDTARISGEMIGASNEYTTVGITTDYKGYASSEAYLKVEIILLPDTGVTVWFDQIAIAMEMIASSSMRIFVDGQTVVVEQ